MKIATDNRGKASRTGSRPSAIRDGKLAERKALSPEPTDEEISENIDLMNEFFYK